MSLLSVSPVKTRADARRFLELPFQLYRHDQHWVPPLRSHERRRWSPQGNPSLASRWQARFLVRRAGTVVGRIAAIIDPAFAQRWLPGGGLFGFFECQDDAEAAQALFAAAEDALAARGVSVVCGPVALTTHNEVGFLVQGFDSPPMLLSPYNPPYYDDLVRAAGYQPWVEYVSYRWTPAAAVSATARRILDRRHRHDADGLRVRRSDPARWRAETSTLYELYNASFARVWGFVPLSWDEFVERVGALKPFYRPELVVFAELGGRPVGFGLALLRRVPRIRTARLLLLGVLPDQAGGVIGPALAAELAAAAREVGLTHGELSLILADNAPMRRIVCAFGGGEEPVKRFRLFRRHLGSAR